MLYLGTCSLNAIGKQSQIQGANSQLAWDQIAQEFHKKAEEITDMLALRTGELLEIWLTFLFPSLSPLPVHPS